MKIRTTATTLIIALALLLSACAFDATAAETGVSAQMRFTDDLGRTVTCAAEPQRVAALIGSYAEVWCLAGGRDTLVAAADDAWTSFDLGLDEGVVNLGAIKTPSLEALLAAKPDLVLASTNTSANLELMDVLEGADIPVAYFDVQGFDD